MSSHEGVAPGDASAHTFSVSSNSFIPEVSTINSTAGTFSCDVTYEVTTSAMDLLIHLVWLFVRVFEITTHSAVIKYLLFATVFSKHTPPLCVCVQTGGGWSSSSSGVRMSSRMFLPLLQQKQKYVLKVLLWDKNHQKPVGKSACGSLD